VADQTIATLVAGGDLLPVRPDEELKRLAELAVKLEVAQTVKAAADEETLRSRLARSDAGTQWLASLERAKEPWFYFSYGNGLANRYRSWIDDTSLPLATIASYIERLESGEALFRSDDRVAERDRITSEHRSLLPESQHEMFDQCIALARTVFPYMENHSFYIDHWYFTIFWQKVRQFGALLVQHGFLGDPEDVF
jgi:pyruvate,water dikinase